MKVRGKPVIFTLTVRRHSLSADLDVIMTALDGGAPALSPAFAEAASRRQASRERENLIFIVRG
jgi:hypothetical protein